MNTRNYREDEQAKGAVRLEPKGKWVVRRDCRTSDTGNTPTGRESGPKVSAVKYVERGNLMPSPSGMGLFALSVGWCRVKMFSGACTEGLD